MDLLSTNYAIIQGESIVSKHDSLYTFKGYWWTSKDEPSDPSEGDCYLPAETGTAATGWSDLSVSDGELIVYSNDEWTTETIKFSGVINSMVNPKFENLAADGFGTGWSDLYDGNVFSVSGGVLSVDEVNDSSVNLTQTVYEDIVKSGTILKIYFEAYTPAGIEGSSYTFSLRFWGNDFSSLSVFTMELNDKEGWHTYQQYINLSDIDGITSDVTRRRLDFRIGVVGFKLKDPLFSFDEATKKEYYINKSNVTSVIDENLGVANVVNAKGDSLTSGAGGDGVTYLSTLVDYLDADGLDWDGVNYGVGGEDSVTISARCGGFSAYIKDELTLLGNGNTTTIPTYDDEGTTRYGLLSRANDLEVLPLQQGLSSRINPCYVNGIECTLTWTGSNFTIARNDTNSRDVIIPESTEIVFNDNKATRGVDIIFIGQNGGFVDEEDLKDQVRKIADSNKDGRFIAMTTHGSGSTDDLVELFKEEFGNNYIDLKQYLVNDAIYDVIDQGFLPDDGTYPTATDVSDMSAGNVPSTLLYDSIHLTAYGYQAIGYRCYIKGKELGYW